MAVYLLDLVHLTSQLEDKSIISLVRYQQVGAVAQEKRDDLPLSSRLQRFFCFSHRFGQGHQPDRSADAEGGVAGHGLPLSDFQLWTARAQGRRQLFILIHRTSKKRKKGHTAPKYTSVPIITNLAGK